MHGIFFSGVLHLLLRQCAAAENPMLMSLHLRSVLSEGAHALGQTQKMSGLRKVEETPEAAEISSLFTKMDWVISESSSAGLYKDLGNQDSHAAVLFSRGDTAAMDVGYGLFIVADGHDRFGHTASNKAIELVSRGMGNLFEGTANFSTYVSQVATNEKKDEREVGRYLLERGIMHVVSAANAAIRPGGSTLSVAVADYEHENLAVGSLGDSPVVRVDHARKTLVPLSASHNMESFEEFDKQVKRIAAWFKGKESTKAYSAESNTLHIFWNNHDQFNKTENTFANFFQNLEVLKRLYNVQDDEAEQSTEASTDSSTGSSTGSNAAAFLQLKARPADKEDGLPLDKQRPRQLAEDADMLDTAENEQLQGSRKDYRFGDTFGDWGVGGSFLETDADPTTETPTTEPAEITSMASFPQGGLPQIDGRPVAVNSRRGEASVELLVYPSWADKERVEQLHWSFRLGDIQMSRALGDDQRNEFLWDVNSDLASHAFLTGMPEVRLYDMTETPMDELLLMSDGVDNVVAAMEAIDIYNELLDCNRQQKSDCLVDPVPLLEEYSKQPSDVVVFRPFWEAWSALYNKIMEKTMQTLYKILEEVKVEAENDPTTIADRFRMRILEIDEKLPSRIGDDITVLYVRRPTSQLGGSVTDQRIRKH